jgi:predicted dehydrogenase
MAKIAVCQQDVRMRIGLLGTGYWAATTLAVALAAHREIVFAGVWGRDPAKAASLAARHGVRAYGDLDALLDDVDAVAVALPPDVQAELALRAAHAGKHLLLDKPLALTVDAADRLVEAVEARRLASLVFFTNRFVPSVAAFLRDAGTTGGWYAAHGTMYASIFQPGNPYGDSVWRKRHGGLWDLGPHALSVLLPLLGPVAEVNAADGPRETVHLLLRHHGGAASTVSLTLDAAPDATAFTVAYFGEHGATVLPTIDVTLAHAYGVAIDALLAQVASAAADESQLAHGNAIPARAVADVMPAHACDARFGRDVVAILDAADRARREHRIVPVAVV